MSEQGVFRDFGTRAGPVLLSNILNSLVTFAALAVFAVRLSPAGFGPLSIGVSIAMVSAVLLDLGLNTTLVRAQANSHSDQEADGLFTDFLVLNGCLLAVASVVGLPLAPALAAFLFPSSVGFAPLVYLSFLAGALLNVQTTCRAHHQARGQIGRLVRLAATASILQAVCVSFWYLGNSRSQSWALADLYVFPVAVAVAVDLLVEKHRFSLMGQGSFGTGREGSGMAGGWL